MKNTMQMLKQKTSRECYFDIVKYLYETFHANIEAKDKNGNTPIDLASKRGHLEIVKSLYETCRAKITKEMIKNTARHYLSSHYLRNQ